MIHLWVSRRLSAHLDGELSPRAMLAVDRHLARCARCAGHWEGLRRVRATLQGAVRSGPPPEAWLQLRGQMAAPAGEGAEPSPRGPIPASAAARHWRPAWTAAAVAVLLLAGAASFYLAGPRRPAPNPAAASFVTTAELVEQDPVSLSPSIELLLAARRDEGPDAGEDR